MTPAEAVATLERGEPFEPPDGFGEAVFARVLAVRFSDRSASARLLNGLNVWLRKRRRGERGLLFRSRAVLHLDAGELEGAARDFLRAGAEAVDPVDRLAWKVGAIDVLARLGRVAAADRLAREIGNGLENLGRPDLAARAWWNLGNALLWQDRYSEARAALGRAIPDLSEAEQPMAELSLSTAELFGGNVRDGRALAERCAGEFRARGLEGLAWDADLNGVRADLLDGQFDVARVRCDGLLGEGLSQPQRARTLECRADALLELGLAAEAGKDYRAAAGMLRGQAMNRATCLLGAALAVRRSAPDQAAAELKRARSAFLRTNNRPWAAVCWSTQARWSLDQGDATAARRALRLADASGRGAPWLQDELGLLRSELGRDSRSAAKLARTLDRRGRPDLAWRAWYLAARHGAASQRLPRFRRMLKAILVERARRTSSLTRAVLFDDKMAALREYLGTLLSEPRPARVAEALEVVTQTRSVTLLDELAAATPEEHTREALERLRSALATMGTFADDPASQGAARRQDAGRPAVSGVRLSAAVEVVGRRVAPVGSARAVVLLQDERSFVAIQNGKATRLRLEPGGLRARLEWLAFDLLAPMADPGADPTAAEAALAALRHDLLGGIEAGWPTNLLLSPEGDLWGVPWSALLPEHDVFLALHPSAVPPSGPGGGPNLIWVGEDSRLPAIAREAEWLRRRYPSARVCGSVAEVRALPPQAEFSLHVCAHAVHEPRNPMLSAIRLGDGWLSAAELARSGLRVRRVVLSACETATVSPLASLEPDGLVRAFLARGASSVVGAAWPLDDRAAFVAVKGLYQALDSGAPLAYALRCARTEARSKHPHPYAWNSWTMFAGHPGPK